MNEPLYRPGDLVLDVYQVERQLGSGGFNEVYLAKHKFLPRQYAVKVMRSQVAKSEVEQARLKSRVEREAVVLARFEHPNLPTLHDMRLDHGMPVLVLEYLKGKDLAEVLARVGTLSVVDALYVGIEVCKPLYIAHQKGIVHRDIKPENIFCLAEEPAEGKAVLRLLDFGASRLMGEKQRLTKENAVVGTMYYVAPEALERGATPDHRVDIYALGLVLWEALVGFHPFDPDGVGVPPQRMAYLQGTQPVPDVQAFRSDVPPRFAEVLRKMVEKHPSKRFSTMQDVYDELWAVLSQLKYDAERAGRPLRSIFTRAGVELPSPEIAARSRRRGSVPAAGDGDKTDEMLAPELSVAAWTTPEPDPGMRQKGGLPYATTEESLVERAARGRSTDELELALGEASAASRLDAADALREQAGVRSAAALEQALRSEKDPRVRDALARALDVVRFEDARVAFVRSPMADPSAQSRASYEDTERDRLRQIGGLARTSIGAPTNKERLNALMALDRLASDYARRVKLALAVLDPPEDLGDITLTEADRIVALEKLLLAGVDRFVLAVASRGLSQSPHNKVRRACAKVIAEQGDARHLGLLQRLLDEGLPPDLVRIVRSAHRAIGGRAERPLPEILPMDPMRLFLVERRQADIKRTWRQDLLAVLAAVGVVLIALTAWALWRR